ncbi:MAG: HD domain-containing protein [Acidobacteria bacterium]|nr:HD domain-containing protein [Acidobacteriota bacterium]MBI3262443.1 HD domain-containing protein [Acidobacteriota bacterium]
MTTLTARFEDALHYANALHGTQRRKGSDVPYISHLLGVASLVLDDGGDEDEAIAALLHDAAEDHGGRPRLDDIRIRYGDKVARIVEHCTDSWAQHKEPWVERKQRYVEHAGTLPADALRVSAADKVHNAYTILRDLRKVGESVWDRFNATADDVVEYYAGLVRAFRQAGDGPLVGELERIVNGIRREMGS